MDLIGVHTSVRIWGVSGAQSMQNVVSYGFSSAVKTFIYGRFYEFLIIYSETSLIRSPTGLVKSDLNGEVTILPGANILLFALWNTIRD